MALRYLSLSKGKRVKKKWQVSHLRMRAAGVAPKIFPCVKGRMFSAVGRCCHSIHLPMIVGVVFARKLDVDKNYVVRALV